MRRFLRAAALLVVLAAMPPRAWANGRFPATVSVAFQQGNARRILVGTTIGLLDSQDDGATWRWICEKTIGYGGTYDPTFAATSTGTLLATTVQGLSVSRDGGCSWTYAAGPMSGHWAADVYIAVDGSIWVPTVTSGAANDVYVSRDDAMTFTPVGLTVDGAWWKRARVAPSNPMRVYVSGYRMAPADGGSIPEPLLERSDDGGKTWTSIPFSFGGESQLLLLDVSPTDPDTVFARIDGDAQDTLLRSSDGALTWTPVLTFNDDLRGFVIRPDGVHALAGSRTGGVRVSSDGGKTWVPPTQQPQMACVGDRSDDELFACGANWDPDRFALGRSSDAQTWTKVFRLADITGPLVCPMGTAQRDMCAPLWPGIAGQLGIPAGDAGPRVDAGKATGGGSGCGCGVGLAGVFLVLPFRRRRRR